ncbi:MAG: aspartate aminotransferase family protein, partial [Gammaproteobacteria bacterium]
MLERDSLRFLDEALTVLEQGFAAMPEFKPTSLPPEGRQVLIETARRLQDNYPYPHPLYAGQMLKPPHAMARLAYMLALWIN